MMARWMTSGRGRWVSASAIAEYSVRDAFRAALDGLAISTPAAAMVMARICRLQVESGELAHRRACRQAHLDRERLSAEPFASPPRSVQKEMKQLL